MKGIRAQFRVDLRGLHSPGRRIRLDRLGQAYLALRISGIRKVFGDCDNSLDVGESEDPPLAVAGHLRVFAGLETPTEGVGVDAQERAQVPRPVAVLLGDSKSVTLGR